MKTINDTQVTDEMYTYAKSLCGRGAKVFLSKMDDDHTGAYPKMGCSNCNGGGKLLLEWFTTALEDTPVSSVSMSIKTKKGVKWGGKGTMVYNCPVCQTKPAPVRL